jgi:hypothetical protein
MSPFERLLLISIWLPKSDDSCNFLLHCKPDVKIATHSAGRGFR